MCHFYQTVLLLEQVYDDAVLLEFSVTAYSGRWQVNDAEEFCPGNFAFVSMTKSSPIANVITVRGHCSEFSLSMLSAQFGFGKRVSHKLACNVNYASVRHQIVKLETFAAMTLMQFLQENTVGSIRISTCRKLI